MPYGKNTAICSNCGQPYITGDCIELDGKCDKCETGYDSYGDWYDNGPGSENFKREIRKGNLEFIKNHTNPLLSIGQKRLKTKKNGKNLVEMTEAMAWRLKDDVKLSPFVLMPKGLLEEAVKASRRLLRYVEELEK